MSSSLLADRGVFLMNVLAHLETLLISMLGSLGGWAYLVLFLVVFLEIGVVAMPFLPGNTFLFAVGALGGLGPSPLDLRLLIVTALAGACLGDITNYMTGRFLGARLMLWGESRFFKRQYLEQTEIFYRKHGGKTLILARWAPIVRTFAPFVAGIGRMALPRFLILSFLGAALWLVTCLGTGYLFGRIEPKAAPQGFESPSHNP
jgi:membrane-associated protein